jgi:S1/P1 Nuclease
MTIRGSRKRSQTVLVGALALLLVFPPEARAWGNAGHEAVACVAWQQLKANVRTRVLALLQMVPTLHSPNGQKSIPGFAEWVTDLPAGLSQDQQNMYLFMRAATWPDSIKHQWLKDSDTPPPNVTSDVNIGFTDTASHGYWHFVDAALSSDSSALPRTPVPNAMTQIVALRAAIESAEADALKAYDMIWLEHLAGDIHQPLHGAVRYFAGKGDEGGNTVQIDLPAAMQRLFEGAVAKSAPRELHAFWDDLPGEGEPAAALKTATSFAKALAAAPPAQTADSMPAHWAAESLALAKKDAYAAPIGSGPRPQSGRASYVITQAYYNQALQDAKDRIALAGSRLAKLLNDNLR